MGGELSELSNLPSKRMRLEDVTASSFPLGGPNNTVVPGAPQMELQHPERQASQVISF